MSYNFRGYAAFGFTRGPRRWLGHVTYYTNARASSFHVFRLYCRRFQRELDT